jgi:uncharacterized membrane protein
MKAAEEIVEMKKNTDKLIEDERTKQIEAR